MNAKSKGYDAAPLQREDDDLDRWRFAAEIVEVVSATPAEWSSRIGIFGKWGEGKSTVLRFAENMLCEKGSIVFTFNPWAIQNWNDLWEEFGNNLSEALDAAGIPFDHSWKKGLKASSKWLESSGVGKIADNVAAVWGKEKLYNAAFGALTRWLKYDGDQIRAIREKLNGQRLVVLIDDLDRCAPALIPQLLLSLRELLDLPGFTFILAFDDEIVANALTDKNPAWGQGTDFLEKILDFRFHLPAVSEKQKAKLMARAMTKYCSFVPTESSNKIKDLLPRNPRKLKSLIRSMAALQPQIGRHDPDELNWSDVWLAQMLRLESYRLFERLLQGNSLDEEAGMVHRFKFRESRNRSNKEDENAGLKRLMTEVGIDELDSQARIIQLIESIRARATLKFRYMCELTLRPHAVTWKEFRLFFDSWENNPTPAVLREWISQHANDRAVSTDDVEDELFEAAIGKRHELLRQASDSNSINEQESYLKEASSLLNMLEQFLLNLGKLSASRFRTLYAQFGHWIGFRINPGDKLQREREEQMLLTILSPASNELSSEIFEIILPNNWDLDIGDGTLALKKALRTKCADIVAPRAAREALEFLARDGAIRSLTENGRFSAVKYCLFDSQSPIWQSKLRNDLISVIRKGRDDEVIYENVGEYVDLLVRGLRQGGIDALDARQISELLKDKDFVRCIWETVTCKQIQYRMQMSFIQTRQVLIDAGAPEAALPLPKELCARLEQESQKNAPGTATGAVSVMSQSGGESS